MKQIFKKLILPLFNVLFLLGGCKEFIEPDLSNRSVKLLAPANQTESRLANQTFWWEQVDDALYYRLQVVSPDFDHARRFVIDTLVIKNQFSLNLDTGKYQWRVRAENGNSRSNFSTANLHIVQTGSSAVTSLSISSKKGSADGN